MHKTLYASGFIYHSPTQKILLRLPNKKIDNTSSLWQMFGEISQKEKPTQDLFQKMIYKFLKLKINPADIYPVYDYFHTALNKVHYVYYAEINHMPKVLVSKGHTLSWFTFKQITKLSFNPQTKQDLIVAQRVINAKSRAAAPKPTP